jgi:hypothetical protein
VTPDNAASLARICQRLDGIPLAIEMAAARINLLSTEQLSERLDDVFRLLTGSSRTALPRHQTLRATIDWSYQLLNEREKILFARLGAFVGGCTLEAAEGIGNSDDTLPLDVVDGIAELVDQSLLRQEEDPGGTPRFVMLETIREYALERLVASDDEEATRRRHAEYYLALAERTAPALLGPEVAAWLARLEAEHDNLRAALGWAVGQGETALALPLAGMAARRHLCRSKSLAAVAFGLRLPLIVALWPTHVGGNFLKNQLPMIEQRRLVEVCCRRYLVARKRHPVDQDRVEVVADEAGEAHSSEFDAQRPSDRPLRHEPPGMWRNATYPGAHKALAQNRPLWVSVLRKSRTLSGEVPTA